MLKKLDKVMDTDEKILFMKELMTIDYTSKKQRKKYKRMKPYYQYNEEPLKNYRYFQIITNKNLVLLDPDRSRFPFWRKKVNINYMCQPRDEFMFYDWKYLTLITKYVRIKKNDYTIWVSFEIPEHQLYGDDAPSGSFDYLTKIEFEQVINILIELAPNAKVEEDYQ